MVQRQLQQRVGRLMQFVGAGMFALALRTSYLAIGPSETLVEAATRPSYRVEPIAAPRGSIFDRCGRPLATNRLCYEVGVCYRDLMSYPAVRAVWRGGKRQRHYPRRERVRELALCLASELALNYPQVEDFIYSEAALNPAQTLVLRRDLDEELFYRLKAREASLPGLRVRIGLHRHYPQGPVAGHLLGYVGGLDRAEWKREMGHLASLQSQLAIEEDPASWQLLSEQLQAARVRLLQLDQFVGKAGVERMQELQLRGQQGQRFLHLNARGLTLEPPKEVPPVPGKDIKLCLDLQLQQFAEQLLARNELIRDQQLEPAHYTQAQRWVKGGSVVVMDPHTGHILALASYPRFDPEQFMRPADWLDLNTPPLRSRHFWLEDRVWRAGLWDGRWQMWREVLPEENSHFKWQSQSSSWRYFLEAVCGPQSPILACFERIQSVGRLWRIGWAFDQLKHYLGAEIDSWALINFLYSRDRPYWPSGELQELELLRGRWLEVEAAAPVEGYRRILDRELAELSSNFDKMLMIELCGLLIDESALGPEDSELLEEVSAEEYRQHTKAYLLLQRAAYQLLERWHQEGPFELWRLMHQRSFLRTMRAEERAQSQLARPYLYYLERERKRQFSQLWQSEGRELVQLLISGGACESQQLSMMNALQSGINSHPLSGSLQAAILQLRTLLDRIDGNLMSRYLESMRSFDQLARPLWATYPLLLGGKPALRSDLAAKIYPKYGYGYLTHKAISYLGPPGSIYKLVVAYEALMQRYRSNRELSFEALSPFQILDLNYQQGSKRVVGKWSSGKEIYQIYRGGRLPKSQRRYIGSIDLLGAIEASSNPYFALLASELHQGSADLIRASYALGWGRKSGIDLPYERAGLLPFDLESNPTGLYTTAIGQHTLLGTPLQAAVMMSAFANGGTILRPKIVDDGCGAEVRGQIELPDRVREYLLEGMRRVVSGPRGTARSSGLRSYGPRTSERKVIDRMVPYMIGKTSTAEYVEVTALSPPKEGAKHSNIWFAGILFDQPLYQGAAAQRVHFKGRHPQLVIVVCLQLGQFGKEAFPIAALLADYWKQIEGKAIGRAHSSTWVEEASEGGTK